MHKHAPIYMCAHTNTVQTVGVNYSVEMLGGNSILGP